MYNCSEFYLDDVMAIAAIPVEDYALDSEWMLSTVIPSNRFNPSFTHAVVIGLRPAVSNGDLIPIIRGTGKAKDTESDSVAGRKHNTVVNCEVDDRNSATWSLLRKLEQTPAHLLLTFRGGRQAFVAGSQDTYQCGTERNGAKTSVSFKIENCTGIQLIA